MSDEPAMKERGQRDELGPLTSALMILARRNVPPDIQELLLTGNPMLKVAPGALTDLVATIRNAALEEAAKVAQAQFWAFVGGRRVVSRQASPDEIATAILALKEKGPETEKPASPFGEAGA